MDVACNVHTLKTTPTEPIDDGDKEQEYLRNRLIHSYDNLDDSIVWVILKKHIPVLKKEVEKELNKQ